MDELVRDLCELAPRALRDADQGAIHRSRVATRRLTAAVRLLRPMLSREYRRPFQKALRSLRRRLARMRDIDVMLGHLRPFLEHVRYGQAARWLTDRLDETRRAEQSRGKGGATAVRALAKLGCWLAIREEVKSADPRLASLLSEAIPAQLDAFAGDARRLQAAGNGAASPDTPQDPHQLRIDGKLLRYSVELAAVAGTPMPGSAVKQLKRMQDALGLWHDYVVLSEHMLRIGLEADVAFHSPALYEGILDLSKLFWRRSGRHLAKFSELWAKEGEALVKALPPLQAVRETVSAPDVLTSGGAADALPAREPEFAGPTSGTPAQ